MWLREASSRRWRRRKYERPGVRRSSIAQFVRFALVGSVGFVVDGGLLWIVVSGGADPYAARAVSFPVAVFVTWLLNRLWTFALADKLSPARQFRAYFLVQLGGVATNLAAYTIVIEAFGKAAPVAMAAFAAGSFFGMFVNFAGSRAFVFRRDAGEPSAPGE